MKVYAPFTYICLKVETDTAISTFQPKHYCKAPTHCLTVPIFYAEPVSVSMINWDLLIALSPCMDVQDMCVCRQQNLKNAGIFSGGMNRFNSGKNITATKILHFYTLLCIFYDSCLRSC